MWCLCVCVCVMWDWCTAAGRIHGERRNDTQLRTYLALSNQLRFERVLMGGNEKNMRCHHCIHRAHMESTRINRRADMIQAHTLQQQCVLRNVTIIICHSSLHLPASGIWINCLSNLLISSHALSLAMIITLHSTLQTRQVQLKFLCSIECEILKAQHLWRGRRCW